MSREREREIHTHAKKKERHMSTLVYIEMNFLDVATYLRTKIAQTDVPIDI